MLRSTTALVSYAMLEAVWGFALLCLWMTGTVVEAKSVGLCGKLLSNGWRYGLVKADHYRPIEEQNLIQPLLTIPLVVGMLKYGIETK